MKIEDISPGRYWMYDADTSCGVVVGEVIEVIPERNEVICKFKPSGYSFHTTLVRPPFKILKKYSEEENKKNGTILKNWFPWLFS